MDRSTLEMLTKEQLIDAYVGLNYKYKALAEKYNNSGKHFSWEETNRRKDV